MDYTKKELVDLLTQIHLAMDKTPVKGLGMPQELWVMLSKITGIKWPREEMTPEEIEQRRLRIAIEEGKW